MPAPGVMSDRQFANAGNTPQGGASRMLYSSQAANPSTGYAVSHPGTERVYDRMTPGDADEHRRTMTTHPAAKDRPSDAMQGAWNQGGKAYADLSFLHLDRHKAATAMHTGQQQAMHDFAKDRDIYSRPNLSTISGTHDLGYEGKSQRFKRDTALGR